MAPLEAPPFNVSIVWVTVTIQDLSNKKGYNMSRS